MSEDLNQIDINSQEAKYCNFLVIAKNGYNLREHSSFNYRSPVEILNSSGVSLSVTVGGLWT